MVTFVERLLLGLLFHQLIIGHAWHSRFLMIWILSNVFAKTELVLKRFSIHARNE